MDARNIFFKYDGSRFYMSRDDMEFEYRRFNVPEELEEQWLTALATQKLALLDKSPNGGVIHYFWHHSDVRHLQRFVQTEPLGDFGCRCAYVSDLLSYIKICVPCYPSSAIDEALQYALKHAESLAAQATDQNMKARASRIVSSVRSVIEEFDGLSTYPTS